MLAQCKRSADSQCVMGLIIHTTMPATQADIDALTRAIATGERQVTLGNQSVTYRSVGELMQARETLQREVDAEALKAAGTQRRKQYRVYQSGRGYE